MTSCAISQSNYIPWKGYFDLINTVDEFVLFDCVQYTRRDWRNRNKIKTPKGLQWLSVPVHSKGNYDSPIDSILIEDRNFAESHWQTISHNYAKAPFFSSYAPTIKACFEGASQFTRLSEVNLSFIKCICSLLNIATRITDSREYDIAEGKTERLCSICRQLKADKYYSGPAAKSYLDEPLMEAEGISTVWMNYQGYPEYPQLFPPFEHSVSILDLIFNCGPDSSKYINTSPAGEASNGQ